METRAQIRHGVSLRHHRNQTALCLSHGAASAAPSSYYRQQVQMVKGRCSAGREKKEKGGEGERKKKEQAPGPSVVTVWGCSCYD